MFDNLLSAENIFESSKFLIFLNKISCLLFTSIVKSSHGNFKAQTKTRDVIVFIIFTIFGIYSIINSFTSDSNIDMTKSKVSQIVVYVKIRIQLFQTIMATAVAFVNRENYFEILKKIHEIDSKVC